MLGLLALLGGIISGGDSGWRPAQIGFALAGVLLLGAFGWGQRRTSAPLLARLAAGRRLAAVVGGHVASTTTWGCSTVKICTTDSSGSNRP